jgi:hypothetical protein
MKHVLVSFASNSYKDHFKTLVDWASPVFDDLMLWGEHELENTWFYQHMSESYGESFFKGRGYGYWSWKPTLILAAMEKYPNSYIFYSDANIIPRMKYKPDPNDFMQEDYFITRYEYFNNMQFTHRDCFIEMGCDDVPYWYAKQVWAAFLGFKNTRNIKDFLHKWDYFCSNSTCIADQFKGKNTYNKTNFPDFQDHRHDQSILSLLVQQHQLSTKQFEPFFNHNLWKDK